MGIENQFPLLYTKIGEKFGAEVIYRDESVSNDSASTYVVIKDLLSKIDTREVDYFVLLQPTSPLRNEQHIKEAIELFEININNYDTLVSVKESSKSSDLIKPIDETLSLKYFDKDFSNYKRQTYKEFEPNGAIFISKIDTYLKVRHFFGKQGIAYVMNEDDSIDVDGRNDFELAINLLIRKNKKNETEKMVKSRIHEKGILHTIVDKPITLVGHSFFDKWDVDKILGLEVNNLGINGCTATLYQNEVLNKLKTNSVGEYIFVMFGTNEIVFENNITYEGERRSENSLIRDENRIVCTVCEAAELEHSGKGRKLSLPFGDAAGKMSLEYAYLYPPGVPLVVPGGRVM